LTVFGDCRDYRGIVRRRWPGEVKFIAQIARDTQNSQSQAKLCGLLRQAEAEEIPSKRSTKLCWRRDFTSSIHQALRLIYRASELRAFAVGVLSPLEGLFECFLTNL